MPPLILVPKQSHPIIWLQIQFDMAMTIKPLASVKISFLDPKLMWLPTGHLHLDFPVETSNQQALSQLCQLFPRPDALSVSTLSLVNFFLPDILLFHTISKSWQIYVLTSPTTCTGNNLDCDWPLSKEGVSHCKPQSISCWSVALVATWACDWYLKGVGKNLMGLKP